MRTIALEEHFWTAELAAPPGTGQLAAWGPGVGDQLRDLGPLRLADMDAAGIDLQVISHVAPAAQGQAGAVGLARAREANDQLAAFDAMLAAAHTILADRRRWVTAIWSICTSAVGHGWPPCVRSGG